MPPSASPAPLFSIIVPTLNEEKGLAATLRALRRLRSQPYELVVSDSGSSDRTRQVAREFADQVVSYNDQPKTAARGRNVGAAVARGDILVFIDADVDIQNIDAFFTTLAELFASNPQVVGAVPRINVFPHLHTAGDRFAFALVNGGFWLLNNYCGVGAGGGDCHVVRRDAFAQVGGYNPELRSGEDNEFMSRLAKVGRTRSVWSLVVYHEGRHEHAVGWTRLWGRWITDGIYIRLTGKPYRNDWKVIR